MQWNYQNKANIKNKYVGKYLMQCRKWTAQKLLISNNKRILSSNLNKSKLSKTPSIKE